jgi:hypothetical protein
MDSLVTDARLSGYLHHQYPHSLSEFGVPIRLPHSGGWILERQIPDSPYQDAMGCYPLFLCRDWSRLSDDLNHLQNQLVCLSLVTDPFGSYTEMYLRHCFKDIVIPFKNHFVVDLKTLLEESVSAHHRYYARKSLKTATVIQVEEPDSQIDDWCSLYTNLIKRHDISGLRAFSKHTFQQQLSVPGIVTFRAQAQDQLLGMHLWYVVNNRAYHHLSAYSDAGYRSRISYGLLWSALNYFQQRGLRYLDLGGGAGLDNQEDGLSKFKEGWASTTRLVYFCGRILNSTLYHQLNRLTGAIDTNYFPAYRDGEFSSRKNQPETA